MRHIKKIRVSLHFSEENQIPLGEIIQHQRKLLFKYHPALLQRNLPVSPIKLPLSSRVVDMSSFPFDGLTGLFNDSLPDGWGRLLLDRKLTALGLPFQELTPLDRLAYVGQNGQGALTYLPEIKGQEDSTPVLLEIWEKEINDLYEGTDSYLLESLFQAGGSSGGARPKVNLLWNPVTESLRKGNLAQEGEEYWLVKFPSSIDLHDIAHVEYAYYLMAKNAGIDMSDCRLFYGKSRKAYFGTKRFDRQDNNNRLHMHSASGLIHDNFRLSQMDYGHLMDAAFRLEHDTQVYAKVLRLAAFNIFSHNQDDHSKNFAFLMDAQGQWTMAPAYDLTFSHSGHGFHSTMVAGESQTPNSRHLLELAKYFSLSNGPTIIEEVKESISHWRAFAEDAGVSKSSKLKIQKVLERLLKG